MTIGTCCYDDCEETFHISPKTSEMPESVYCKDHRYHGDVFKLKPEFKEKTLTVGDKEIPVNDLEWEYTGADEETVGVASVNKDEEEARTPFRDQMIPSKVTIEGSENSLERVYCDEPGCDQWRLVTKEKARGGYSFSCRDHSDEENFGRRLKDSDPQSPYPSEDEIGVADVLEKGKKTYESKNEDYGESWRKAGEMLWQMSDEEGFEIRSVEEAIQIGLYFQRIHKLNRSFNGEFVNRDLNNESVVDSHEDETVYAGMSAVVSREMEE